MKKEEFIKKLEDLQSRIGQWKIEVEKEIFVDFSMGCFYDVSENKWKVYINNERGRHRVRLVTDNEETAFDKLLSIVNFEIENNRYIER